MEKKTFPPKIMDRLLIPLQLPLLRLPPLGKSSLCTHCKKLLRCAGMPALSEAHCLAYTERGFRVAENI